MPKAKTDDVLLLCVIFEMSRGLGNGSLAVCGLVCDVKQHLNIKMTNFVTIMMTS